MEEPHRNAAPIDSQHYRVIASKLRDIARQCRFPGARQEILDLASRYERRADSLDSRSAAASDKNLRYPRSRSVEHYPSAFSRNIGATPSPYPLHIPPHQGAE